MRLPACLLLLVGLNGCGGPGDDIYTALAPDGLHRVIVRERSGFGDSAVTVLVGRTPIAGANDCSVQFAHAAWRGSQVSVFVDGLWCGKIRVAYDTATGKQIDFASTEDWLRRDIVSAYQITPQELDWKNGDVLAWVSYDGHTRGIEEFRFRHRKQTPR